MDDDPNGRLHQILKVVSLSNYWSGLHQILNFGLYAKTNFISLKMNMNLNRRLSQT